MDLFNNIIEQDKFKQEKMKSNNNLMFNTIDKEKNMEMNSTFKKSAFSIADSNYEKDKNQSKAKVLSKYGQNFYFNQ